MFATTDGLIDRLIYYRRNLTNDAIILFTIPLTIGETTPVSCRPTKADRLDREQIKLLLDGLL